MGKILWQWVEERERGGLSECARLPSTQPSNFKKPVRPKTPSSFFHSNQSWHKQWPYRPLTLDKTLSLRYSSISLLCFFDSWTFTVRKRKRVFRSFAKGSVEIWPKECLNMTSAKQKWRSQVKGRFASCCFVVVHLSSRLCREKNNLFAQFDRKRIRMKKMTPRWALWSNKS